MSSRLEWLGSLPLEEAEAQLLTCCASRRWARKMVANRPYLGELGLEEAAVAGIRELEWPDIEEALAAHPRIGDRAEAVRSHGISQREAQWSSQEQSGTATASVEVLDELTARNIAYENRFGHVFLIRATGRSAGEMLAELHRRLHNSAADERETVRAELADITVLRIRKLLGLL
ncbi:2-oxo-4-hydroxy-4-carboxy-5-ureidoimidazoline decarboxylase [Nocardia sp. 2]|uniref:2-oxo-4-hydroxy-4-carboxy-5-ureidoimidazoline decarboxylase n=1 Tax=Nocardia acididurans TaxID=2802282 RepID=A0ABS1M759_9NOCA|nr:2-oxo-4-hydroxy-4-carboxy-5-ureidoimidazoline decarboxylase [Nocardia acididurans]MBL1076488.1 2-oxo-4-hydroxy-4-carboxy-5-ureidoimidazoline decarboxylase [Nocardia acididurans]